MFWLLRESFRVNDTYMIIGTIPYTKHGALHFMLVDIF